MKGDIRITIILNYIIENDEKIGALMEEKNKIPWKYDVAVLLIFFARPDKFEKTFAAIRKARPRVLLLWQDGPRENHPEDEENIYECRNIANDIDWECEIYKQYHEKNIGCDPSTYLSHKWAFSIVDQCIILEDDVVASESFFKFCVEMLNRYKDDERICRISGMNQVNGFKCPDSYFFSDTGSVWGWATWKRVADSWDEDYCFLDDKYLMDIVKINRRFDRSYDKYLETCKKHAKSGKQHWETIQTFSRYLNSQLIIIPSRNLVKNVGLGEGSTHSNIELKCIPKHIRKAFYQDYEEMVFPLKHPKYVINNVNYWKEFTKITGSGHFWISKLRKIESICLRLKYEGIKKLIKRKERKI